MKRSLLPLLILTTAAGSLVSCSSVKSTMKKVANPVKSMAKTNVERLKKMKFPLKGNRKDAPPIVEVRKDDLKKIKTAEEKILAFNRSREADRLRLKSPGGEIFMPVDFDPSDLPVGGQIPTTGILPPLNPGGNTAAEVPDPSASLPADVAALPEIPAPVPELPEEEEGE